MGGGETEFSRWFNSNTSDGLKVTLKKGEAVLFYSMLPDGNMDDHPNVDLPPQFIQAETNFTVENLTLPTLSLIRLPLLFLTPHCSPRLCPLTRGIIQMPRNIPFVQSPA